MKNTKLEQFKAALQAAISRYIEQQSPDKGENLSTCYRVLFTIDNRDVSFLFNQQELSCFKEETIEPLSWHTVSLQSMPEREQRHLHVLLSELVASETGCGLWQTVYQEVKNMPGWWSFFSDLRPLTMDLENILNQYQPEFLKHEDDQWIKATFEFLKQQIEALLEKIKSLASQCENLKQDNVRLKTELQEGLIGRDEAIRIANEQTETVIRKKDALLEELEHLRKNYEKVMQKNDELKQATQVLLTENQELADTNRLLSQHITSLLGELEKKSVDMETTTSSVTQQRIEEEDGNFREKMNDQYKKFLRLSGRKKDSSSPSFWTKGKTDKKDETSSDVVSQPFGKFG